MLTLHTLRRPVRDAGEETRPAAIRGCISGYTSNDDRIAAMNLYSMGNEYLVQSGKSMSLAGGVRSMTPDVTPADPELSGPVINAGGISRPLQGSHKPLLQGVSLSRGI